MNYGENAEEIEAALKFLKDAKAEDITVIKTDIETTGTDFIIVCKGTAFVHVAAVANALKEQIKKEFGISPSIFEGREHGRWIVLEYPFAVFHIMLQEIRDYYRIEEIHDNCEQEII